MWSFRKEISKVAGHLRAWRGRESKWCYQLPVFVSQADDKGYLPSASSTRELITLRQGSSDLEGRDACKS